MIKGLSETMDIASDVEFDKVLTDLPFEMVKDLINKQIDDLSSNSTNYIEVVRDKFQLMNDEYADDEDTLRQIKYLAVDIYAGIIQKISDKFDLGIEVDYSDVVDTQQTAISLYYFFVTRFIKNIKKFVKRFISNNRKQLVAIFDNGEKRKDVTTFMFKKQNEKKHKDDILIMSSMTTIIRTILTDYRFTNTDFLDLCCSSSSIEHLQITHMIDAGIINSDFVPKYFSIVLDSQDILDEIYMHNISKQIQNDQLNN